MCLSFPSQAQRHTRARAHTHTHLPPSPRYHRRTLPLPLNSFHLQNRFAGRLSQGGPGFLSQEGLPAPFPRSPSPSLFSYFCSGSASLLALFLSPDPRPQATPVPLRVARTLDGSGGAGEDDCHSPPQDGPASPSMPEGSPRPSLRLRPTHPEAPGGLHPLRLG